METNLIYEITGYTASVLVAVSLMMSAIVKLRIVNMTGAFIFSVYGILIGSVPVAAMNGFIVLINIYYLVKIHNNKEYFQLLSTSDTSNYLKTFLQYYRNNIINYQPAFSFDKPYNYAKMILSEMVPAGLLLGNMREDGTLRIELDFVIPSYRDFKIGSFLFDKNLSTFKEEGIREIEAVPGNAQHNEYLEKIGFKRDPEESILYKLKIS